LAGAIRAALGTFLARTMFTILMLGALVSLPTLAMSAQPLLQQQQTVPLRDVRGRIDHMAIDPVRHRLFVAALGNDTVEVVDIEAGRRTASLVSMNQPQGVAYASKLDRLYVASGRGERVDAFDETLRAPVGSVASLEDADNLRYESARDRLYVGYGHALAVIDATTMKPVAEIALADHPEAFQLEAGGPRIFINVPGARQIAVVDRTLNKVVATWEVGDDRANFPMALDEGTHRLMIATRHPAALLVYDTETGRRVARVPIAGDADDLFFDGDRQRVYAICGEGVIAVVQREKADHYVAIGQVITARGARTGLFDSSSRMLFVAVPAHDAAPAEIRAYRVD